MTPCLHLHILASGSKGNAALVEGPEGSILIDCGLSRRGLLRRASALGCDANAACGVLLTHEHSDHVSGLTVFAKYYDGPLFATPGTAAARKYLLELPFELLDLGEAFELAGISVTPFATSHDVAEPCGFRFSCQGDSVGWCTDTGVVTTQAAELLYNVRILGLEANHDLNMLEHGPYPRFLKDRVASRVGHLSNSQSAEAVAKLVGPQTETVVALHLSEKNNTPGMAVRALADALDADMLDGEGPEARTADGMVSIFAASQDTPVSIW